MWETLKSYGKEMYQEVERDNVSSLAAALAYYATFSFVPMVILLITIGSALVGEATMRERVLIELHLWVGPSAAEIARGALAHTTAEAGWFASLVSGVMLLVGATRLFTELQHAFDRIWDVRLQGAGLWATLRKRFISLGIIGLLGLVLIASLVATTIISFADDYLGGFAHWELLNTATTFGLGTVLFGVLYRGFPPVKLRVDDVWLAAALTTALLMLAKFLLALYVRHAAIESTYGAAGTLVVFLLWVYVSAQIILFGAVFTQVHARLRGRELSLKPRAEPR